jgi:hypothetical protein
VTGRDFTQALADSRALNELATRAGLTPEQAKKVFSWLADLPVEQVARIADACHKARVRQTNRQTRKR